MAWLTALRRETDLGVPDPVRSRDGSFVVVAEDAGVPVPHACVLMRWLPGRFSDQHLTPAHLRRVGILEARLHDHAESWIPPSGFWRPRVDTVSDAGKVASMAGSAAASLPGDHPTRDDAERCLRLVEALISADLYDLAVTLWELEERPRYGDLRDALLEAYAANRALPEDHVIHLHALFVLRRMQMLMWALESRRHAAFRDRWQAWARDELDAIGVRLDALAA
jgi:Ser/Thr protein kinase RdoA (MazF antagonist)